MQGAGGDPDGGDRLKRQRLLELLGITLLVGVGLVFAVDFDDDDDPWEHAQPAQSASTTPEASPAATNGKLKSAKAFRLRPKKTALKKRAKRLRESNPPAEVAPRPRRAFSENQPLGIPTATWSLQGDRSVLARLAAPCPDEPHPSVARTPRLSRAPPARG